MQCKVPFLAGAATRGIEVSMLIQSVKKIERQSF